MLFKYLDIACLVVDCIVVDGGVYYGVPLPIIDEVVFYSAVWFVLDIFIVHLVTEVE